MEWDSEQEQAAQQKINENSNIKVGEDKQGTYTGREQSMKPMIGKSIDESMPIDALLVNWHRLASANR